MSSFEFLADGGVCSPQKFKASGVVAGLKKSGAPDFAVVYSEVPANFSGAFTSCTFAAAPVKICRKRVLESPYIRACVINSGNANACTGDNGLANAEKTCLMAARELGVKPEEIMVSSTGRIGVQMPMDIIEKGVKLGCAALSHDASEIASRAIMTTDTVPKRAAVKVTVGGKIITIGAMTKGAGMIDPSMKVPHATMLCYVTTDAKIDNVLLKKFMADGAENSFNRITVDGDMSTNDTLIIMANGAAGVEIKAGMPEETAFYQALEALLQNLAKRMVLDGEGATKFVTIKVTGAPAKDDAKKCAEAVANSLLCKTAWFGGDPNWGRVVAALGYSGAQFNPDTTDIFYDHKPVVRQGGDAGTPESELSGIMQQKEFTITINLNSGTADYLVWTCDISYEYVKINADYHT